MILTPLVSAEDAVSSGKQAVFLDVRVGPGAAAAYESAHLGRAIRVDMESDLSDAGDPVDRGRHPLPSFERWLKRVGDWGVTPSTPVFVYDDAGGGMAAARAWWMLRALGHAPLAVVDGGWQALRAAGVEMETGASRASAVGPYPSKLDGWQTVDASFVDRVRVDPTWRVIDARAPERYDGTTEPLDPVAGHIPGAHSLYWKSQLEEDSSFTSLEAIAERYSEILGDVPAERVVCYCGSGVTACHLLLAMDACGLPGAHLYVGSWSAWCRQGRPRAPR